MSGKKQRDLQAHQDMIQRGVEVEELMSAAGCAQTWRLIGWSGSSIRLQLPRDEDLDSDLFTLRCFDAEDRYRHAMAEHTPIPTPHQAWMLSARGMLGAIRFKAFKSMITEDGADPTAELIALAYFAKEEVVPGEVILIPYEEWDAAMQKDLEESIADLLLSPVVGVDIADACHKAISRVTLLLSAMKGRDVP